MKYLIIINDAPYGNERAYNAFRLAMQLQKNKPEIEVNVFLMADAVTCIIQGQNTPNSYYNIERMMKSVLLNKGKIRVCGTCADARGIKNVTLADGIAMSTMSELTEWVVESDKVINF